MVDGAPAVPLPGLAVPVERVGRGSRALADCWSSWPLLSLDLASVRALTRWSFDAAGLGCCLSPLPEAPGGGIEDMIAGWIQFLLLRACGRKDQPTAG